MTSDNPKYLRNRAAHFRHLAAGMDQETQTRLELASEYERRAAALESDSAEDDERDPN